MKRQALNAASLAAVRIAEGRAPCSARPSRGSARRPAPPHLGLVREACWEERALDTVYRDKAGVVTQRRIWPLSVVFLDRTLMLLAWCGLRQGFRRFHLDAMSEVTATPELFRPRRVPLLRLFLKQLRG